MDINACVYSNINVMTLWNFKNVKNLCISNFMAVLQNAYIVVVAALLYLKMSMKAQCFNFHFKRRQMHTKKSFLI